MILLWALISPAVVMAGDYAWLTFHLADDTELSVASENLSITYGDGELLLSSSSVNQTIPVANVRSMKFTSSSSGVELIGVDSAADVHEFFTISGSKAGRFSSLEAARESLPSGVYLVFTGGKTHKIIF